jgi:hypothetical protein
VAKSTFLQLCQATRRACGVQGTGPVAVTNQIGLLEKIVAWVADADHETQSRWFDWDFLHVSTWNATTSIGEASVAAPAMIGTWDEDSFYLGYNTASNKKLKVLDYKDWRKNYRQGVKTNQRPDSVVILPDLSLKLEAPPDGAYLLTADYWKRPVKMTANGDTSPIPEEYERIIIARAKMMFAEDQGATDIMVSAQIEFDDLLDKLEAKYLPNQNGRRMADPGMLVVRPE